MSADMTYNGWKNRPTWNVALWVQNDEGLYREAVDYVERTRRAGRRVAYISFAMAAGLRNARTPDGIIFTGRTLDYPALSAMLREMAE